MGAGGFGGGAQHGSRRRQEAASRAAGPVRNRAPTTGGAWLGQVWLHLRTALLIFDVGVISHMHAG